MCAQFHQLKTCYLSWFQVINDLLDPTGQNLRVREDAQVLTNSSMSMLSVCGI